jgi:hypothetical protein
MPSWGTENQIRTAIGGFTIDLASGVGAWLTHTEICGSAFNSGDGTVFASPVANNARRASRGPVSLEDVGTAPMAAYVLDTPGLDRVE